MTLKDARGRAEELLVGLPGRARERLQIELSRASSARENVRKQVVVWNAKLAHLKERARPQTPAAK